MYRFDVELPLIFSQKYIISGEIVCGRIILDFDSINEEAIEHRHLFTNAVLCIRSFKRINDKISKKYSADKYSIFKDFLVQRNIKCFELSVIKQNLEFITQHTSIDRIKNSKNKMHSLSFRFFCWKWVKLIDFTFTSMQYHSFTLC